MLFLRLDTLIESIFIENKSANKTMCASIIDRDLIDRISLGIIHRNLVIHWKVVRNYLARSKLILEVSLNFFLKSWGTSSRGANSSWRWALTNLKVRKVHFNVFNGYGMPLAQLSLELNSKCYYSSISHPFWPPFGSYFVISHPNKDLNSCCWLDLLVTAHLQDEIDPRDF